MLRKIWDFLATLTLLVTLAGTMSVLLLGACAWGTMVGRKQIWNRFIDMEIPQNKVFEAVFPPQWKWDEGEAPPGRVVSPGVRQFLDLQTLPDRGTSDT